MADFLTAYKKTSISEGGYANDANDNGGETYKGISRKFNPSWSGWQIIDSEKSNPNFPRILKDNAALEEWVKHIYRNNYWNPVWGDRLTYQEVANYIYDTSVNFNPVTAIRLCQKSYALGYDVNMTDEHAKTELEKLGYVYGKMDEKTLSLFNGKDTAT